MNEDEVIIEFNDDSERNPWRTAAKWAAALENAGYASSAAGVFQPELSLPAAAAAAVGGTTRNILSAIAGDQSWKHAISSLPAAIGLPAIGAFIPGYGPLKAAKAVQTAENAAQAATRAQRAISGARSFAKIGGRYLGGVAGNGALTYGIPAMIDRDYADPLYGFQDIRDDIEGLGDLDLRSMSRLGQTFILPIAWNLPRYRQYLKSKGGTQKGNNSNTSSEAAGTPRSTESSAPRSTESSAPKTNTYDSNAMKKGFEESALSTAALLTAGGLGAASRARAQIQPIYNGMHGNAAVLGAQIDAMSNKPKQQNKPKKRPQTSTGTLTGRALPLTRGLILGRKTGGKLEMLKELRK